MVPQRLRRQRRERVTEVIFMMHALVIKDFLRRVTNRQAQMIANSIAVLKQPSATKTVENAGLAGEQAVDVETKGTPRREARLGEQDTFNPAQEPASKKVILIGQPTKRFGMVWMSRQIGSSESSASDFPNAAEADEYAKERFKELQDRSAELARAVVAATVIQSFWIRHKRRRQSQKERLSAVR